jgi:peroxiredoxin
MTDDCFSQAPPEGHNFRKFTEPPPANDFEMLTPDGSIIRLSDLFGKVLILNFWREDCKFCPLEKGHLRMMLKALNRPDVMVVYVNLWDDVQWVKKYASRHSGPYVFGMKRPRGMSVIENVVRGRRLGYYVLNSRKEAVYEIKGFPTSYVINKSGRVAAAHIGMAQWSVKSIREWIRQLAQDQ